MLPLLLALITAIVLFFVIAPLLRPTQAAVPRAHYDRAVYRDQLKELQRDLARGVIGAHEAETARLEIERRLLAADRGGAAAPPPNAPRPRLALVLALLIAGGAGGLYLWRGAPGIPDLPYAARAHEAAKDAAALERQAATLEQRLAAKPDDVEGWAALAELEGELSRWDKSAEAYRHALALAPDRAELSAGYAEALVFAAGGIVTPAAQDIFAKLAAKDPKSPIARYYLALADAQAGRTDAAIAAWQKLAGEAPEGAPIRAELQRRMAAAAAQAGIATPPLAPGLAAPAGSGPTEAQMAAAQNLSPEQRQAMIRGMVERLAARLQSSPDDLDGWLRLGRAYAVLGDSGKAADAYEHAAKLDPQNAEIPLDEAEALLPKDAIHDPIPARAVALLQQVDRMQPGQPAALWYLGIAAAQARNFGEATGYWQRLLAEMPEDAPERKTVSAALDAIKAK